MFVVQGESMMIFVRRVLSIISVLLFASLIYSHPHTFIDYKIDFKFDTKGLAAIKTIWKFDEMFTQMVKTYDENEDNIFQETEIATLKSEAFDNLKEYNYFAKIYINGKVFEVKFIKNFRAEINGNQLIYSFSIPCHVTATTALKIISVIFFDPTYYIHVDPAMDDIAWTASNASLFDVAVQKSESEKDAYYQGMIVPFRFDMKFSRK